MANKIFNTTIIQKNASGDKNIIYPKTVTKNIFDGSSTLDKTLTTLKLPDVSAKTTAFTQAATRQNLVSGETLATSHGKIMKLISDLKSLAYTDTVGVSNLDSTLTTAYNNRVTTDKVTTSTAITNAGYVADARAVNNLQNQINTLNTNYTNLGKSVADGKTLIGNVVGGNSSSTFATLANNAQSIKNQLASMTTDRDKWKNTANSYASQINSGIKTIVGSISSYQVLYSYTFTTGSGDSYGKNCGKDSTGYYYDITLSTRFSDLSKVKLIIRMTGQVDYYNGISGSGGTIRNATTVPKGTLYNNSTGNTILRLYQNYNEVGVASGAGSWNYYFVKYVEYNILYI